MAATLRVVLGVDNASKLTLPTGIPDSLESLKGEIKRHFGLLGNFRLQYRDIEFNDYVNLTATSHIRDKSTVKVIYITSELDTATCSNELSSSEDISLSTASDTDILSSNE